MVAASSTSGGRSTMYARMRNVVNGIAECRVEDDERPVRVVDVQVLEQPEQRDQRHGRGKHQAAEQEQQDRVRRAAPCTRTSPYAAQALNSVVVRMDAAVTITLLVK